MILMPLNSVAAQGIAIISIRKKSNQIKLMMLIANEVNIGNTIQVINTKNLNNENITAMYTCRKHTSPIILWEPPWLSGVQQPLLTKSPYSNYYKFHFRLHFIAFQNKSAVLFTITS